MPSPLRPTYSLTQIGFAFAQSVGSEVAKDTASKLESALAAKVDADLKNGALVGLMGTWKRSWGPRSPSPPIPVRPTRP